ncbi:TPA: hypothetical protein ENS27_04885, partial [bacterium]|nr:hypothetical protein [bacterium]
GAGQFTATNHIQWVDIKQTLNNEPIRIAKLKKDNPVVRTYDLGYIYRIDRAEILFSGMPKDYDILTSKIRNVREYERAISTSSVSREHFYPIISFPPKEARWVQVVVNDWYEASPPNISSIKIGARHIRHNPINSVRTRYNPEETFFLYDGLKFESAPKWLGAKRVEKEVKKDGKSVKEVFYESLGKDGLYITFDLGGSKRVYGIGITTGGPENNIKRYIISLSLDDENYQQVYSSTELENSTFTDSYTFEKPYQARYARLTVPEGGWYGKYPEIKEVEIYTEDYRPSTFNESIENNNASQVFYDDCGTNANAFAPNMIQGFPFDRGENSDPKIRYSFKSGDEVDTSNPPEALSYCYHYDSVIFSYSGLEPDSLYWVGVTYLQEKDGKRIQNLVADGFILHDAMPIPTNTAKRLIFPIPPEAYEDGKINLSFNRIDGPNAIVSEVMIYRARVGKSIPITYQGEKTGAEIFAKAPIITAPVTIDGLLDDWQIIYPIVPQYFANAPYNSPSQMYTQWDKDNLFILLRVNRDKLQQLANVRNFMQSSDTLHLFIDTIYEASKSMYKSNNHHIVFSNLGSQENKVSVSQIHHYLDAIPRTKENLSDIEFAYKAIAGTSDYILEARIPKDKVLKDFAPQQDSIIGLNYVLSNPYLVEREDNVNKAIIKGFNPIFWSASSIDSAPMFWGKLELIGTISGQPAIMDRNMTKNLTSFNAGDIISLTVIDPDRNRDKNSSETIKVRISGDITGDSKEVTLYETVIPKDGQSEDQSDMSIQTVNDSNFFASRIKTQFGEVPNDDPMILAVQGKELVTLEYIDPYYAPNKTNERVTYTATAKIGTTGVLQILSRTGREIKRFPAGLRLFFKVQDEDLIRLEGEDQSEPAKVTLKLISQNDYEEITLIDDKNTGSFIGAIETEYNTEGTKNNGKLQVIGGETIEAIYVDALQATGNTNVDVSASAVVDVGNDGKIMIGKTETGEYDDFFEINRFNAGESPTIVVTDVDLNLDKSVAETVDVKVEGDATGDSLTVKLTEIGTDSDTFMGNFPTAYGFKPDKTDNLLEVKGNETIKAIYTDVIQASGATMVEISTTAVINTGADGIVSILKSNYLWDLDKFNAGDTLYLKVWDPDLNLNPQVRDQIEISIVSEKTRDEERVILRERDPDSGVFLGLLKTEFSKEPNSNDKILQVQGGERITAIYVDKLRLTGESNVPVTDSSEVNIGTTAEMAIFTRDDPYTPVGGFPDEGWRKTIKSKETLTIKVNDLDVNTNTVTVIANVEGSSDDSVIITLKEQPNNDGIFMGILMTEYAEKVIKDDSILQVRGGDRIFITYVDILNELGQTNIDIKSELLVKKGYTALIEAKMSKLSETNQSNDNIANMNLQELEKINSISAGNSFVIQIIDNDININPDTIDYTNVTIKGNLLIDEVQLVLQETGNNTGVFWGIVQSESATKPNLDDEILQVSEREIITITYKDEVDAEGKSDIIVSSELTVRTKTAVSLLIVDKDLHKLSDFNAGQRIYFRLDDVLLSSMLYKNARINAVSEATKDIEEVMLEEMPSPGSRRGQGIYVGSIRTTFGKIPIKDGVLQVQGGEEIRVTYISQYADATTRKTEQPVFDNAKVNKGNTGKLSIVSIDNTKLYNFNIGDYIYFRLDDPDENKDNTAIDTVEIKVSGEVVAGAKNVILKETKDDSGIFIGQILTCYGRCLIPESVSSDENMLLNIELVGGEIITAIYFDQLTDTGETNVRITDTARANKIGIATYASDRVIIDGNMSGWPLENALPAGDEGSNLYFQWDAENLYCLAYIMSSNITVPDPIKYWENADAIELFIEIHPILQQDTSKPKTIKDDYYAFWFCPIGGGEDGKEAFVGQSKPIVIWNYTEIEKAVQILPNRYILEARIPFKTVLGGFDPFETQEEDIIGFNYIIRRSNAKPLLWAPIEKDEAEKPPSHFGTIIFRK